MKLIEWLQRWFRARQRKVDLKILWPICKEMAEDLDEAKATFMVHVMHDEAWTADYTEAEAISFVSNLK